VSIKKDEHYFYHSIFRKGNYLNLSLIKRKKKGKNHISSLDEEKIYSYIREQSKNASFPLCNSVANTIILEEPEMISVNNLSQKGNE